MEWSVVIPAGRPGAARETLASLQAQTFFPPSGWEAIVVSPHALTPPIIGPVRGVLMSKLEIPGVMRNAGAAQAKGNWLLFIDDDISLAPDFFAKLYSLIQQIPTESRRPIGAIGPRLPGPATSYAGQLTDISNFWAQQAHAAGDRPWLYSATIAIPSSLFRQLGGFSSVLRIGEDIDLTQRIAHSNHSVRYEPSLVAWHRHGRATFPRMIRYFWDNGGAAPFLHQHCDYPRCFSIPTAIRHAYRDARSNWEINHDTIPALPRLILGVFLNYLIFQLSVEWHHQRGLLTSDRFTSLRPQVPADMLTQKALADFQKNRRARGALRYMRALLHDIFDAPRR